MLRKRTKGQSIAEYTFLIVIVLAALLSMATYFRRGIQGRWKVSVDQMGEQYDPRYAHSNITQTIVSNSTMDILARNETGGWWTSREDTANSTEKKSGYSEVSGY